MFPAGPAPPFSPRGEEKSFENQTKLVAGQTSEHGHSAVNGTTNGTNNGEQTNGDSAIKPNDVANKETAAGGISKKKDEDKPSSNLKCLEDPNFSFDEAPSIPHTTNPTANLAASESKPPTEAAGKKPSYRVLEDPDVNVPKPKTTGYKVVNKVKANVIKTDPEMISKVLEDPMMTSIYEPVKPDPAKGRPEEVPISTNFDFISFPKIDNIFLCVFKIF